MLDNIETAVNDMPFWLKISVVGSIGVMMGLLLAELIGRMLG
jgi:ElaB/YqjD/DUF883 family membrane-anchored ribosome-binding protein